MKTLPSVSGSCRALPRHSEPTEAISFARLVYSDLGQIDQYIDWVESIDFHSKKLDSTLYNSAFEAYALEDLGGEQPFAQYLERTKGLFVRKVRYYHAVSLEGRTARRSPDPMGGAVSTRSEATGTLPFSIGQEAFQDSAYDRSRDFFIQLGPDDDPLFTGEPLLPLRIADLQQDAEAVIG